MSSTSCTGVISDTFLIENELKHRGFHPESLGGLMKAYGLVIGGGFATNVLIHDFGHSGVALSQNEESDIDFYVYGGIGPKPPVAAAWPKDTTKGYFESPEAARYLAETRVADTLKKLTLVAFTKHVHPLGYDMYCPSTDESAMYDREVTADGDRIFTTGSDIRYQVLFFQRKNGAGLTQKLNLVFVDTDLHTVMNKVDISLTAGFITGNPSGIWMYHHASPDDLKNLWVRWMQPSATHTPRQIVRLEKYCRRYSVDPTYVLTVPEFLATYDSLPDKCHIEIKCTREEITKAVLRRVRGLIEASVIFDTGEL